MTKGVNMQQVQDAIETAIHQQTETVIGPYGRSPFSGLIDGLLKMPEYSVSGLVFMSPVDVVVWGSCAGRTWTMRMKGE